MGSKKVFLPTVLALSLGTVFFVGGCSQTKKDTVKKDSTNQEVSPEYAAFRASLDISEEQVQLLMKDYKLNDFDRLPATNIVAGLRALVVNAGDQGAKALAQYSITNAAKLGLDDAARTALQAVNTPKQLMEALANSKAAQSVLMNKVITSNSGMIHGFDFSTAIREASRESENISALAGLTKASETASMESITKARSRCFSAACQKVLPGALDDPSLAKHITSEYLESFVEKYLQASPATRELLDTIFAQRVAQLKLFEGQSLYGAKVCKNLNSDALKTLVAAATELDKLGGGRMLTPDELHDSVVTAIARTIYGDQLSVISKNGNAGELEQATVGAIGSSKTRVKNLSCGVCKGTLGLTNIVCSN